mmetsp:Transcript_41695/g.54916  ORF Transcript_41695/g.54916 Transcript_41695/m.54916 type:complete len:136 (-) Transcript_41695:812-1219(-)
MPVLSSAYPSRQAWSKFHHSELPDPASFFYRYTVFKQYYRNALELHWHKQALKKVIPDTRLIDDYDQDRSMVVGQGAKTGLYQAIMMKPRNVEYVYPLAKDRSELQVPDYLANESGLVVFNVEAARADDLMQHRE